ncbi:MAG: helix-turn-helix domain-containing protein [Bacteroidaceae bacterium]|nr:helix-turn-helix domain-containing protein [Bacteroidaceae bacterium]
MNIGLIRNLAEKREGGIKKLARDIGMSEANLHRCINNNKIQAGDLENAAIALGVDIRVFFDLAATNQKPLSGDDKNQQLLQLCKALVSNYQQRDEVMSQLVLMVKCVE